MYLKFKNNNKAETILRCVWDAVSSYGTDQGMENITIAEYMIRARGLNRKSVIAGKSTTKE